MLSRDFVFLVLVSVVLSTPIAYYFMSNWLVRFEYRTEMPWWVFAGAGSCSLIITLLTVSYQSVKAAMTNPAKSLRSE
jgi:ABC-type antimicrobial peptide transport system permease subunit